MFSRNERINSRHPLSGRRFAEALQQFAMDAVKAAVGKDADDILGTGIADEMLHDGVGVGKIGSGFAGESQVLHEAIRVEAILRTQLFKAGDLGDDDAIGTFKGVDEFLLEDISTGGVGAGFEHGPESAPGEPDAQGAQGFPDGGGMMTEIVDDRDAAGVPPDVHAACDALEQVEGGLDDGIGKAAMPGTGDDGEGVADVEFTDEGDAEADISQLELGVVGVKGEAGGVHFIGGIETEAFDRAMGDAEKGIQVGIIAIGEEQTVAGDEVDEAFEGELDVGKGREDVGVIELEVVDDGDFGEVVDELGALVEKGGVVLIAFDDEPGGISEACALAEIAGDAADEERGVEAGVFEDPGEE